jgi:hypothetical protein
MAWSKIDRSVALAQPKHTEREKEQEKCKRSLWYLATNYLNYGWNPRAGKGLFRGKGLTERLHKPICDWFDAHADEHFMGMWISRWHHKTTLVICQIIQDILRHPDIAMFYFHSVEEEAERVNREVIQHVKFNEKLRGLDPIGRRADGRPYNVFPKKGQKTVNGKRWDGSSEMWLYRPVEYYQRFPTLLAKGSKSEITGSHANKAYLDDIITGKTVRENQLGVVSDWVQHTVIPVVDDMVLRVSGTPWSDWGLYTDWQSDPDWRTLILPGATLEPLESIDWSANKIELTRDDTLKNPIYGLGDDESLERQRKKLNILKRQMKNNFDPQIMCDPSPKSQKVWSVDECERWLTYKEAMKGPGTIFVLGDPAPLNVGSLDGRGEKARGDGTKDEWAMAVTRLRVNGDRLEKILLDGDASRFWTKNEGFDEMARLAKFYGTPYMENEATGQAIALYEEELLKSARRIGARWTRIRWVDADGKRKTGLSWTYKGKNHYFEALASSARCDEVFIVKPETLPESRRHVFQNFLFGTEKDFGCLPQVRGWRVLESGRNALRYDDRANVWCFCVDPALEFAAPTPKVVKQEDFWTEEDLGPMLPQRTRYCGAA